MSSRLFVTGVVVAAAFPILTIVGLSAHSLMGCSGGGSSGPATGCRILGFEFNLIANMGTLAFIVSFFTVPVGALLSIIGLIAMAVTPSGKKQLSHGVYNPEGRRLNLVEASSAISQFDQVQCDSLLQSFGEQPGAREESLTELQSRCINVITKAEAYAP